MATKATVEAPPSPAKATEPNAVAASGNLTLAQLGQRMSQARKGSSASNTAQTSGAPAAPATSSEQADAGEAALSQSETDDSTALEAAAATGAETESTEATSEAPEGQAEGDDEEDAKQPKALRKLQDRVGKVTEQRNEAREELARLQARVAELETQNPKNQKAEAREEHPADGMSDRSVQEIDTTLTGVESFLSWAAENPDGGTFTEGGKTYELGADDVRTYRLKSETERIRLMTRRESRLESMRQDFDARRQQNHAEALRLYPWIEQKASAEFQEAIAIIRENPDVLKRPDFELVIARQVVGQRLEREALKKAKASGMTRPKGSSTPTPVVTHAGTSIPRASARAEAATAVEGQFRKTGKISDLSKLFAQRRAARVETAKTG